MESAKLVKVMDEPLRALQELENSMRSLGLLEDQTVHDLTLDDETVQVQSKVSSHVIQKEYFILI